MRGKWIVAGVLAAGALFVVTRRTRPPAVGPQPAGAAPPSAELVLPARIRAQHVAPVAAPVAGILESPLVEVGEQVYEGQLLGRIRNESLAGEEQSAASELERAQAKLAELEDQLTNVRLEAARARAEAARAQAELDRAERAYQRQQALHKEGATPRLVYEKSAREYDTARTVRDGAEERARGVEDRLARLATTADAARRSAGERTQALDEAKQQAAAAEIHAPATGLVVGRTRQQGEEVTPEVKDLFEIATDTTALEAILTGEPAALARLRVGQEVFISSADAPDTIAAKIDELRGGEAVIRFTAPEAIRPGSTAQVRIKTP